MLVIDNQIEDKANPQELGSIKKPGETEFVSKEESEWRIREIAKCKRDICYFAEKYFKIINMSSGLQTIKLYPKQKQLLEHLIKNDRSVVLASRQTGRQFALIAV